MSILTSFLQLFKYEPVVDQNLTFNITTALNENWDKIDTAIVSHQAETMPHAAVSTATANRIMSRDASGRSQVANGVVGADIATISQLNATNVLMWMGD